MRFEKHDLTEAFADLGLASWSAGKVIDLCIYGGSCLMLVSDFRVSSADVDAVALTDQPFIDRIARDIAIRRDWPEDWLNDGVRTYLSPNVEAPDVHLLTGTYPSEDRPGLRVYVPRPEYMLAMKLMALRVDEASGAKDLHDILNLMSVAGVKTKAELIDVAARFYPEARVSAKLRLSADALIAESRNRDSSRHAPPQYFGRGRGGGQDE